MKIAYYPDTRTLAIHFADRVEVEGEEVTPGLVVHFDAEGRAVGIEIEDVTTLGLDVSELDVSGVPLTRVLAEAAVAAPRG